MKIIKSFEEFIKEGVVKKITPDYERAKFLIKESEKNYSFLLELLAKLKITNNNANNLIKICYDIMAGIIRAKMLAKGYNSSGFRAHESEVSFTRSLNFNEPDIQFLDQIRYFRNGMLYYGTILDKEYAEKVIEFTKRIYLKLKKILQNANQK